MKKTSFLLSIVLLGTMCFGACNGSEAKIPGTDSKTTQPVVKTEGEPLSHSVSNSGVTVTLTTDKAVYEAGDDVNYSILIENDRMFWNTKAFKFAYSEFDGLKAADGTELPCSVPQIKYGESYELSGTLMEGEEQDGEKKSVKSGGSSDGDEVIKLRPYVKVVYGEKEVTIRAIMEIQMVQEKVHVKVSQKDTPKRITCHDPSIFRDFDGTYYIFGTHMGAGYTDDLRNWTSMDGAFRLSFTEEVKAKIREWNKDSNVRNWYDYLWAPDIIYNKAMKKYCLYLSANGDDWVSNIVLLTSDTIKGPYDYAGSVVYGGFDETSWGKTDGEKATGESTIPERYLVNGVGNRKWGDKWPNCIDPCAFYDDDGKLWMAYGSWSGGIFILELDEETGLRDYSVKYDNNEHSDAYFGTKIAGGAYVSGEGAFIQKIGDYYWLFVSYGGLEAASGYNIRVYRSDRPDGGYVDALGNDTYSDKYVFNYNLPNKGTRLFGNYMWRTFNYADVAQGHNSALVDEDGRAYIVYHTRTNNGSEGHTVKVLQLFVNKEGWLCAAPYQTSGEKTDASRLEVASYAGQYEVILHELDVDYANLQFNGPRFVQLNADGTVTGEMEGTWALEEGTSYITLVLDGVTYSGVALYMNVENTKIETSVFTALGKENQLTIWGSKVIE